MLCLEIFYFLKVKIENQKPHGRFLPLEIQYASMSTSLYIWSPSCWGLLRMWMLIGLTWIDWQRVLTLLPFRRAPHQISWFISMLCKWLPIMVYLFPWCHTNTLRLLTCFGRGFMTIWVPTFISVQHIILISIKKVTGRFRNSRICWGHVINFDGAWDLYFPLVEFSYNNNVHASIGEHWCRDQDYWCYIECSWEATYYT